MSIRIFISVIFYIKPLSAAAINSDKNKRQNEGIYFIKGFLTLICAICAQTIRKAIESADKKTTSL